VGMCEWAWFFTAKISGSGTHSMGVGQW